MDTETVPWLKKIREKIANTITLSRLLVLAAFVFFLFEGIGKGTLLLPFMIIILFVIDWLDGFAARTVGKETLLGKILDITVDRIVENILWLAFASLEMVPFWAAAVVLTRSFLVDSVRSHALSIGYTPFGMQQGKIGKLIVGSRPMRGIYGFAKLAMFTFLSMRSGYGDESTEGILPWLKPGEWTHLLVIIVVGLCILRGLPVLIEGRRFLKED